MSIHCSSLVAKQENPYSIPIEYPWQEAYLGALLELDCVQLQLKIVVAETEIYTRLPELNDSVEDAHEVQAARDALSGLACVKRFARDTEQ
jgi:hypothetical protein